MVVLVWFTNLGSLLWLDAPPELSFSQVAPVPTSLAEFPLYLLNNRRWICKSILADMLVHL